MKVQLLSAACALLALTTQCSAFGVAVPHTASRICIPGQTESTTSLNIFGNLKGAFSNDDSLGKVDATPGLKGVSGMNSWRDHCLVRHELCQICSHPLLIHIFALPTRTHMWHRQGPNVSECTINGKPVKAVAGQKVSQVAAAARVKITYSCKKGDCGTCEVMQNGRIVKACQAKINSGKCDIRTL